MAAMVIGTLEAGRMHWLLFPSANRDENNLVNVRDAGEFLRLFYSMLAIFLLGSISSCIKAILAYSFI